MSFIIKYKPKDMYVEDISRDFRRIYLCEDGLEALQFSEYETAENALKMTYQDLDNWEIVEQKENENEENKD